MFVLLTSTYQNPASARLARDELPGPVLRLGHEVTVSCCIWVLALEGNYSCPTMQEDRFIKCLMLLN